jgi:uncharacterized Zn finger protein
MAKKLDHKLECKDCGTIYLDIPIDVKSTSPIHCSSCGQYIGRWEEIETDFALQGGQHGVFKMDKGEITQIDEDRKLSS